MNKHINVNISTRPYAYSRHQEARSLTNKLVFDEFGDDLRIEGKPTDHKVRRNQLDELLRKITPITQYLNLKSLLKIKVS